MDGLGKGITVIGVTEIPRVYSKNMRLAFALGAVYEHVWLSPKAQAVVNEARAREHAYWLVGAKHPNQMAN